MMVSQQIWEKKKKQLSWCWDAKPAWRQHRQLWCEMKTVIYWSAVCAHVRHELEGSWRQFFWERKKNSKQKGCTPGLNKNWCAGNEREEILSPCTHTTQLWTLKHAESMNEHLPFQSKDYVLHSLPLRLILCVESNQTRRHAAADTRCSRSGSGTGSNDVRVFHGRQDTSGCFASPQTVVASLQGGTSAWDYWHTHVGFWAV